MISNKRLLDGIFKMQEDLSGIINASGRYPCSKGDRISVLCTAVMHEVYELEDAVTPQDRRDELVDVIHFVTQLSLEAGVRATDVHADGFFIARTGGTLNTRRLFHTTCRLQRLTPWKWWKKPVPLDNEEARRLILDLWKGSASACRALGIDNDELLEMYKSKHDINIKRQEDGY